jgi:glycosyltransferase involved in cell wall biosynthesis
LKQPSRFFYFSAASLNHNARKTAQYSRGGEDGVFFRSSTPWCYCSPDLPYFVYTDIVFHTFFENTFNPRDFITADLQRIYDAEARFLEGASVVFFESNWGLQKARDAYSLGGDHYVVANRGGVLSPPEGDTWPGEPLILLSIAMRFEQKGGDIILNAFKKLKNAYPDLRWHIVGGKPTGDWEGVEGIVYEGVLNPDDQTDLHHRGSLFRVPQYLGEPVCIA